MANVIVVWAHITAGHGAHMYLMWYIWVCCDKWHLDQFSHFGTAHICNQHTHRRTDNAAHASMQHSLSVCGLVCHSSLHLALSAWDVG